MSNDKCELCQSAPAESEHHLFPGDNTKPKLMVCDACHSTIHRTFTNKELTRVFNSQFALAGHPIITKWILWRRKHPDAKVKTKMTKERRQKGRYS